jgi:hypothetical protein
MINKINYKITIDEEYSEGENLGLQMIAFTKRPAIMVKGMAFNSQAKVQYFNDDLKYRICAPVMIPMEIYRNDEDGEYTVTFTEEEIEKIYSKFMMNYSSTEIFNLEHDAKEVVPAYILEIWIVVNPKLDKSYTTFNIQVPKGTVMVTSQVTDKDYYNELVKNGQTGYSIEGFLGMKLSEINNNKNKNEEKMNEINSILPAGEYTDKDGNVFVVAEDGSITVKEVEMEVAPKEKEMGLEVAPEAEAEPEISGSTETKLEEVVEDTETEVEMAEDVVEAPVEVAPVETYSKEEVDAKFEEIYKMIAAMQAEDDAEDAIEEEAPVQTQMSVNERFAAFARFSREQL